MQNNHKIQNMTHFPRAGRLISQARRKRYENNNHRGAVRYLPPDKEANNGTVCSLSKIVVKTTVVSWMDRACEGE